MAATGTFTSSCDDRSGVRAPKLVPLLLDEDGDEDGDEDAEGEVGKEGDAGEEGGGDAADAADAAGGLRIIPGCCSGREVESCAGVCAGPKRIDWRSAAILPDRTGS